MKKYLVLPIALLFLMLTTSFSIDPGTPKTGKERIEIAFNASTGFTELVMIKSYCEEKGITLNYKKIEYDEEGKLKSISFKVDCRDGFSGAASSQMMSKTKFGFYRDYNPEATSPFGCGPLTP
jgi:hypothetical protein